MNCHRFILEVPSELVFSRQRATQIRAIQRRQERIRVGMTSQGRGKSKRSEPSEVGATPIRSHPEDASANHTPIWEKISLRAHEIYLERGGLQGNELDDWLQAERELERSAPQVGEPTDRNYRKT